MAGDGCVDCRWPPPARSSGRLARPAAWPTNTPSDPCTCVSMRTLFGVGTESVSESVRGRYGHRMDQRVSIVTLGVADVGRARRFYEALGWSGQEVEETVFFQAGGMAVVLWGREKLAADAGLDTAPTDTAPIDDRVGGPFGGIALALNVRSTAEVDDAIRRAAEAGGTVTSYPAPTFYGGYAGYFRDPDGHVWEIAHNPGFTLDPDGNLILPDFGTGTGT